MQRRWTSEERARIVDLRDAGMAFSTIAALLEAREGQVRAQYHDMKAAPAAVSPSVHYEPMENIADKVIRPGIDKHLVPLCLYKGTITFGRIHRWWNFALAAMEQGASEVSDVVKLSHNEGYSHLCGPTAKVQAISVYSFFSRLRLNPRVTDNISGMTEWAELILPRPFDLRPVPLVSHDHRDRLAPWRIFKGKPRQPRIPKAPSDIACYPFIAHDPRKSDGADLVMRVHKAVPRGIPHEIRADICQDLICAILAGEFAIENLTGGTIQEFISAGRKIFSDKWSHVSLEDTVAGTDDLTVGSMI